MSKAEEIDFNENLRQNYAKACKLLGVKEDPAVTKAINPEPDAAAPVQVEMEEYRKPLVEGLLGMCSLLGGVYATSMLVESALQAVHHGVKKHVLGKKE